MSSQCHYVLQTTHGGWGEGRGNLSGPGKVCIHTGRHHTNNLRTLKKHHINPCQVTLCQGQTPHGNVNKNCSTDVLYGCRNTMNNFTGSTRVITVFAIPVWFKKKKKPIIQGIKTLLLIFTWSVSWNKADYFVITSPNIQNETIFFNECTYV